MLDRFYENLFLYSIIHIQYTSIDISIDTIVLGWVVDAYLYDKMLDLIWYYFWKSNQYEF